MTFDVVFPDKGVRVGKRYRQSYLFGEFLDVTISLKGTSFLWFIFADRTYEVPWSGVSVRTSTPDGETREVNMYQVPPQAHSFSILLYSSWTKSETNSDEK